MFRCLGTRSEHIAILVCLAEHPSLMEVNGRQPGTPARMRGGCLVHWKRSESDRNTTKMDLEQHGDHVWLHLGLQCRCWEPYCPSCPPLLHSDKITPKILAFFSGKIVRKHSFLYIQLYIQCKCCQKLQGRSTPIHPVYHIKEGLIHMVLQLFRYTAALIKSMHLAFLLSVLEFRPRGSMLERY